MSEMLAETKTRPPTDEEIKTMEKANKIIADMQMDCLKKFPMEMRVTYLLNIIFRAAEKQKMDDIAEISKTVNYSKVNEILNLEKSPYDFNIYGEIKSVEELSNLRDKIICASCGLGPWQKKICKDCGKEFYLDKSEVDFFVRKELQLPVRCKSCRDKRKSSHK